MRRTPWVRAAIGAGAMLAAACSQGAPRGEARRVVAVPASRAVRVSGEGEAPGPPPAPTLVSVGRAAPRSPAEIPPRAGERSAAAPPHPRDVLPDEDEAAQRFLVATSKETIVHARPSARSPHLGYLRTGALVSRRGGPAGYDGCRGGFYEVAPEGFVCVGAGASLDPDHELARAAIRRADRTEALPYVYGSSPVAGAPLYTRVPTAEQAHEAEPDLDQHLRHASGASFDGLPLDDVPWFLAGGAPSITVNGNRFSRQSVVSGTTIPRASFAFVSLFEAQGRRFGLTVDMNVLPLDRLARIEPSRFHGLPLGDAPLPVAFVRSRGASLYSGDPHTSGLQIARRLEFREAVPLAGERVQVGKKAWLRTRDDHWLQDQSLVRADPPDSMPPAAAGGGTWIDVSIDHQTLVAYEGTRPVFVTLVSTGIDGKGDPGTTHSTVQGEFRVHTKHVTVTMDSDEVDDQFDLRDVPYVQYFKQGYALHAAYWHDGFGAPRSHGCVNLSPLDARWLFAWTEPKVPTAWHGAMSNRGTVLSIHP